MAEVNAKKIKIGDEEFEYLNSGCIVTRDSVPYEYGPEYLENYLKMAKTPMSDAICAFRKRFANHFCRTGWMLDYGCGAGLIVQEDRSGRWRGYDINPDVEQLLGDNFDPNPDLSKYDCICFFDSLEHVPNPEDLLAEIDEGAVVIVTIPILPPAYLTRMGKTQSIRKTHPITKWKHFKPREHLMYCTYEGFLKFMEDQGFRHIGYAKNEVDIGREDVGTLAFIKETK